MGFCAENGGNWSSSPQNDLEFSPASPGDQLQEITVSTFRFKLGRIRSNLRSDRTKRFFRKKGDFLQTEPLDKRETALDTLINDLLIKSWRKLLIISPSEARKTKFQHFGAKAHLFHANGLQINPTA